LYKCLLPQASLFCFSGCELWRENERIKTQKKESDRVEADHLQKGRYIVSVHQAAQRRHAQTVRILTHLPVLVQDRKSIKRTKTNKATVINLALARITVTQSASGEIIIEIEPP